MGIMANSMAAKPQSPIGTHWKKWLKASDPVAYKGCVVMLVVIAQLASSGVEQCNKLASSGVEQCNKLALSGVAQCKEKIKEGSECVCQSISRGMTRVLAMRATPRAVLVTSFLSQLLIVLCGHILQLHNHSQ